MPTPRSHKRPRTSRAALLCWLAAGVALAQPVPVAAEAAGDAGTRLALEVYLDGRDTGLIAKFVRTGDGAFWTTRQELAELGFDPAKLPEARNGSQKELIALDRLPDARVRYDDDAQAIYISAAASAFRVTRIDERGAAPPARISPLGTGAVLSYSLVASGAPANHALVSTPSFGAQLDGRIFGSFGVITSSALVSNSDPRKLSAMRLDTSWSFDDPGALLSYRAGDLVNRGLSGTRPIRLGGIQIGRSFELRPDMITQPLPIVRGTAEVPSSLDLFVNSAPTLSSQIPQGPFEVAIPPSNGAGVAEVRVRDLLGRESVIDLPFYTSDSLLAPGLTDFSVEAGLPRRNYGLRSADYDHRLMASGTIRHGLSSTATLQAHAELSSQLLNFGGGGTMALGTYAILSGAVAASWS